MFAAESVFVQLVCLEWSSDVSYCNCMDSQDMPFSKWDNIICEL